MPDQAKTKTENSITLIENRTGNKRVITGAIAESIAETLVKSKRYRREGDRVEVDAATAKEIYDQEEARLTKLDNDLKTAQDKLKADQKLLAKGQQDLKAAQDKLKADQEAFEKSKTTK